MDLLLRPITNICSGHRWRLATRLRVRLAATEFRARRGPRPHLAATRPPPLVGYLGDEDPRHRHRDSEGWLAYLRLEDRPGLSPITTVGRSTPSKMHRWRPTRCGRRGDPRRSIPLCSSRGFASFLGRVEGGRRPRPVRVVGSLSGPGVACAEAPGVRTLGRARRLVGVFSELPPPA